MNIDFSHLHNCQIEEILEVIILTQKTDDVGNYFHEQVVMELTLHFEDFCHKVSLIEIV